VIRTYFWLPTETNVGHSSAQIGCANETYASYVSWWPAAEIVLGKSIPGQANSLDGDIRSEGNKQPDKELDIGGLDETEASDWWRSMISNDESKYVLHKENCSWAVVRALEAAGSGKYFPWNHICERFNLPISAFHGSRAFEIIATHGLRAIRAYLKNGRAAIKLPLASLVDDMSPIWSPKDALAYCVILQKNIERAKNGGKLWLPELPEFNAKTFGRLAD
jgi:hypothetical protein